MKKIVIGNLKMNLQSPAERDKYLQWMEKELDGKNLSYSEIVLCPPFVHLEGFAGMKDKKFKLGAQDMFFEGEGSYTGEISPAMLKNFGCEYVILGHSERRKYSGETDAAINAKLLAALKNGLKPILCVGEDKDQIGENVIMRQLKECLAGINRVKIESIIVCYEPVWAISSNNPDHLPTTNEIMSARLLIKKFLAGEYGLKTAERAMIIYGGSVAPSNAKETCVDSGMDGALVGKESLVPHSFVKIAEIINGNF